MDFEDFYNYLIRENMTTEDCGLPLHNGFPYPFNLAVEHYLDQSDILKGGEKRSIKQDQSLESAYQKWNERRKRRSRSKEWWQGNEDGFRDPGEWSPVLLSIPEDASDYEKGRITGINRHRISRR